MYINGQKVNKAITSGMMTIKFKKGKEDNPKINAIVLVRGQKQDTHYSAHAAYKHTLMEIQQEKAEARAKAESLF